MYVFVFISLFLVFAVYIDMRDGYEQVQSKPTQNVQENASKQQTNIGDTMAIEVIPAGASAVVTDNDCRRDDWARDAERVKDVLATMEAAAGTRFADVLKTVKDSEAQLHASGSVNTLNIIQDVKDAESRLTKANSDWFQNVIQDVKDAETRLNSAAADRFIDTIQDIKAVELKAEEAKGRIVDVVRETAYAAERSHSETREYLNAAIKEAEQEAAECCCEIKEVVKDKVDQVLVNQLKEFGNSRELALKIAAEADKTACANQNQILLQFAQQSAQMAECCCELKELIKDKTAEVTALINSQEVDRLRERAQKAENQLSLLDLIKQVVAGK